MFLALSSVSTCKCEGIGKLESSQVEVTTTAHYMFVCTSKYVHICRPCSTWTCLRLLFCIPGLCTEYVCMYVYILYVQDMHAV